MAYVSYEGNHNEYPRSQAQQQLQKSLEASKQKVYMVWGNVINILEELENRKPGGNLLLKSETEYFDHSRKDDETVGEVVQGQLIAMQAILNSSDDRIKPELITKLSTNTKEWMEYRRIHNIPIDIVDQYANKLLEIIQTGKATHNDEFVKAKSVDFPHSREDVQSIIDGSYRSSEVEKMFKDNPGRKAQVPRIRSANESDSQQTLMDFQTADPVQHSSCSRQGQYDTRNFCESITRDEKTYETKITEKRSEIIHISGYQDRMIGITRNNHMVVHSGKSLKIEKLPEIQENIVQIFEIPGCSSILAVDDKGCIHTSIDSSSKWKKNMEIANILQVITGKVKTLLMDQYNSLYELKNEKLSLFKEFTVDKDNLYITFSGKESKWRLDKSGRLFFLNEQKKWSESKGIPQTQGLEKIYGNPCKESIIELWAVDKFGKLYLGLSQMCENDMQWEKEQGPRVNCLAVLNNEVVVLDHNAEIWIRSIPAENPFNGIWKRLDHVTA